MPLFYKRNQEEQRRQFVLILSIICYACAATGFLHSLLLCWEMGHNDNSMWLVLPGTNCSIFVKL